jgi:pimeloyl-ACP methyl ester carboxylesterase
VRSRRIALATGLAYHVLEWEPAAATDTTFVLVHGFLDLAYGWREVAARLAARVHVVAPDLRGHGDSDWIGAGGYYHYLDYVADLDDVVAQLARPRVIAVGHSMGGGVVAYWAGARAERPHAIALLEGLGPPDQSEAPLAGRTARWIDGWRAAPRRAPRVLPSLDDAAARLRRHDPLLGEALARDLAAAGTRPASPAEAIDGGVAWKHDPLHVTEGPYPFRRDHAARYWRAITCPVLVVDGERSMLNLPDAERAARRADLARATHVVLPGAGHMMQRHRPAELAELLLALA